MRLVWAFNAPCLSQLEGRKLAQETIVLRSRMVDAGADADWSKALTRNHVLTAVRSLLRQDLSSI